MNKLEALEKLLEASNRLRATAPVDDDFPSVMHSFHGAVRVANEATEQAPKESVAILPQSLALKGSVLGVAVDRVVAEFVRAEKLFPEWPADPLHGLGVVSEEHGELCKAVLRFTYEEDASFNDVETEAIQTAAMAIRFLISCPEYNFIPSAQHTL